MTNKWTTLVEEQTDKANESIAKVLEEVGEASRSARKNKTIAVVMAVVGLALIGVGVWPFVSNTWLRGDITDNSSNIFTTPQTVENVPLPDEAALIPSDDSEPLNPLDAVSMDDEATLLPVDEPVSPEPLDAGTPDLSNLPGFENDLIGMLPGSPTSFPSDPFATDIVYPSAPEIATPEIYPQNSHTGRTDPNVMLFGAKESMPSSNLHSAAQEMNRSGPEEWVALLLALPLTLFLRRKKLFA